MNEKTKARRIATRVPVVRPPLVLKRGSYTAADENTSRPNSALIQLVANRMSPMY